MTYWGKTYTLSFAKEGQELEQHSTLHTLDQSNNGMKALLFIVSQIMEQDPPPYERWSISGPDGIMSGTRTYSWEEVEQMAKLSRRKPVNDTTSTNEDDAASPWTTLSTQ